VCHYFWCDADCCIFPLHNLLKDAKAGDQKLRKFFHFLTKFSLSAKTEEHLMEGDGQKVLAI